MKFTENKNLLLVKKDVERNIPVATLPITSGENVYLDNDGTVLNDVINSTPTINGSSADEFLIFHFATAEERLHFFKFMATLNDPSEIYLANFIIKAEAGENNSKLNEFTESSGRPQVKIYNKNILIMDLQNVKNFSLYNEYYATIYNKYEEKENNIVALYEDFKAKYPSLLPEHTDANDLREKIKDAEGLYSSIGGRLTFITLEEIDQVFDEVFGPEE